jgi:hypothetical protein
MIIIIIIIKLHQIKGFIWFEEYDCFCTRQYNYELTFYGHSYRAPNEQIIDVDWP